MYCNPIRRVAHQNCLTSTVFVLQCISLCFLTLYDFDHIWQQMQSKYLNKIKRTQVKSSQNRVKNLLSITVSRRSPLGVSPEVEATHHARVAISYCIMSPRQSQGLSHFVLWWVLESQGLTTTYRRQLHSILTWKRKHVLQNVLLHSYLRPLNNKLCEEYLIIQCPFISIINHIKYSKTATISHIMIHSIL